MPLFMKIISGCQTGADQAGLAAAFDNELETGGYVTKNNRTQNGDRPDLIKKYNLTELSSFDYKTRTWKNVENSDITIRFAYDFRSFGEICTLNATKRYNKPCISISVDYLEEKTGLFGKLSDSIKDKKIINIAGNSEKTCPGIYESVYDFLNKFFKYIKNGNN